MPSITTEALVFPGGAFLFISPLQETLKTATTRRFAFFHCEATAYSNLLPPSELTAQASEKAGRIKALVMAKKYLICLIIIVKIQSEFFIFKVSYKSDLINPHNTSEAWIFFFFDSR